MAIRIRSINKIVEDRGIKILVHGPAGAGKTVLCCTSGKPTLIISAEAGLLSVKDAPKYIKGVEVECLADLEEIYEFLCSDEAKGHFDWVCLDSITEIAERILNFEKEHNKDPRKAYMEVQDQMMDLLRKYRDLKDFNVLMTCKQQRVSDESGPTLFAPMMPGSKLWQQIPYLFDEVFALRVEKDAEGNDYRVLQTGRDLRYEAKDRSGALEMFEQPNIKYIERKIKGEGKSKKQSKADVLKDAIADGLGDDKETTAVEESKAVDVESPAELQVEEQESELQEVTIEDDEDVDIPDQK